MARRVARVEPWTSPPGDEGSFSPALLHGARFVVVALHGGPGWTYLQGDGSVVACTAKQIGEARLAGAVVFGIACYLGDESSPMRDAFLAAGASWVIGGSGRNWSGRNLATGAGLLARSFRRLLGLGLAVPTALAWAKRRTALQSWRYPGPVRDALAFSAWPGLEV